MAAIFNTAHNVFPISSNLYLPSSNPSSEAFIPAPKLSDSRKKVFESIFPQSEARSLPTPVATPSNSFVGAPTYQAEALVEHGEGFYRRERYWHVVTSFLSFPANFLEREEGCRHTRSRTRKVVEEYLSRKEEEASRGEENVEEAVRLLARWDEDVRRLSIKNGGMAHTESPPGGTSLSDWYTHEVRRHFLGHVRGRVLKVLVEATSGTKKEEYKLPEKVENVEDHLKGILWELRCSWEVYVGVFRRWILLVPLKTARTQWHQPQMYRPKQELRDNEQEEGIHMARFIKSLNSLISYTLPDPAWSELVYKVFVEWCEIILMKPLSTGEAGLRKGNLQEMEIDSIPETNRSREATSSSPGPPKQARNGQHQSGVILNEESDEEEEEATQRDFPDHASSNTQLTDHEGNIPLISPKGQSLLLERRQMKESGEVLSDFESDYLRLQKEARKKLLSAWEDMQILNLGGSGRRGERVFAEVVHVLITKYIETMYTGEWAAEDGRNIPKEIGDWVEYKVGGLVRLVLLGGKKYTRNRVGIKFAHIMKEGKKKVLSPRASFRASNFGQVVSRAGVRISIDGVMLGDYVSNAMDLESEREKDDDDGIDDIGDVLRAEDIEGWKRMAMGRLGRLRVAELFEIMVDWPESMGGVLDLRAYITTPQTRFHLTTTFTNAIATRILHPAASTTDILRVYISLIRSFSILDPRGVLLDRVTRGIRRYLRERDDTVKVIVRGLMGGNTTKSKLDELEAANKADEDDLHDLAEELMKGSRTTSDYAGNVGPTPGSTVPAGATDEIDYDDMSWVPDPIDAGPDYKKSKGTDVVGSLFSLYDSKEVFVKEFQNVLAERLLENRGEDGDYEREITTLELLRIRFGEAPLQACDVMVKDIHDSKRMDSNIRVDQQLDVYKPSRMQSPTHPNRIMEQYSVETPPELHAKILSRLFWPLMKEEDFEIPKVIKELQERYEAGFEKLNQKRKLTWHNAVGDVYVALEMEDRIVVVEDAKPWQATVVYAFNSEREGERVRKTVFQLKEELEMDESLVRKGLGYWVMKGVLKEVSKDTYTVIERIEEFEDTMSTTNCIEKSKRPRFSSSSLNRNSMGQGYVPKNPLDGAFDSNVSVSLTNASASNKLQTEGPDEFPFPPHFQLYERYVLAMLMNNGPMNTSRIVKMMEMVVPSADAGGVGTGYTEGMEGMRRFLDWLRVKGKITGGEGDNGGDDWESDGDVFWRVRK